MKQQPFYRVRQHRIDGGIEVDYVSRDEVTPATLNKVTVEGDWTCVIVSDYGWKQGQKKGWDLLRQHAAS